MIEWNMLREIEKKYLKISNMFFFYFDKLKKNNLRSIKILELSGEHLAKLQML